MWIFGYGSLVWKADFPYTQKVVGFIKGYERRFWQASIDHRGVPEKPGRVVTLIKSNDPESRVWGMAYKIHRRHIKHVVEHLDNREVMGYEKVTAEFHPLPEHSLSSTGIGIEAAKDLCSTLTLDGLSVPHQQKLEESDSDSGHGSSILNSSPGNSASSDNSEDGSGSDEEPPELRIPSQVPFTVTMYFGSETNEHFVGAESISQIAQHIFECEGASGPNREYLYNLAEAMRQISSEAVDSHLSELEEAVRSLEDKTKDTESDFICEDSSL